MTMPDARIRNTGVEAGKSTVTLDPAGSSHRAGTCTLMTGERMKTSRARKTTAMRLLMTPLRDPQLVAARREGL